jgi:amino acid adenylation domain-containing protein
VEICYALDLYEGRTVERMVEHWGEVLEQMVAEPEQRIGDVSLLRGAEREQVLVEWNRTEAEYGERCVHELFAEQAEKRPEAVAAEYEGGQLSYGELNRRANQLGHYLRKQGVGPEVRVGLCMERSLEMIVAILGVLKAGGAYVPLDPGYPRERLEFILEDAHPKVLLIERRLQEQLLTNGVSVICVDRDWAEIEESGVPADQSDLRVAIHPANAAYVIYTSGSTGRPKGVVVNHGNVVRLMERTHQWFSFDEHDVWPLFHSYAFDFSVWEIWGALLYGGRLVVVPYWVSRSPEEFLELLERERVTVLNQTPSAFQHLMRAEEARAAKPRLSLRRVIFGGEALEFQSLQAWLRRYPEEPQLVNMYGITETTVHVTYQPIQLADVEDKEGRSRIGVRIPDLQIYIFDDGMQPVPVGVRGELYVGGGGVTRGYLNRPELTAERFVPHPYAEGERLYRSGDQASWRGDGSLDYFGRLDQQVKVRGYRIELGEIESALLEQSSVSQAVVVLREYQDGDQRLVAYVVPAQGTWTDQVAAWPEEELRETLKRRLPEYMVPSAFMRLEALPLTPNGKVDRKALPEPQGDAYARREYEAPRGEVESTIAAIWSEELKVDRAGRHDNFFELGGNSLLAVRVIERMRQSGLKVDGMRTLFVAPSLAGLAASVGAQETIVETPPNRIPEVREQRDHPSKEVELRI